MPAPDGSAPSPGALGEFVNLGLADGYVREINERIIALRSDWRLYVHDRQTGVTHELEVQGSFSGVAGPVALVNARESISGMDLNGDGDQLDDVAMLYDADTKELTNLGMAIQSASLWRDICVFGVPEADQGEDLNGDGVLADAVIHSYRLGTEELTNLGVVQTLWGSWNMYVEGRWLVYLAPESTQTPVDLNGDGDFLDTVPHRLDLRTGAVFNTGVAHGPIGWIWVREAGFLFSADE